MKLRRPDTRVKRLIGNGCPWLLVLVAGWFDQVGSLSLFLASGLPFMDLWRRVGVLRSSPALELLQHVNTSTHQVHEVEGTVAIPDTC